MGRKCKGHILSAERCRISPAGGDDACPEQGKYESNKLLIKTIPEGVNEEQLVAFLEAKLDLEHPKNFTVKLKNTSAVVIFTKQYTLEGIHN